MRILKQGMAYLRGLKLKLYFLIFRRDSSCGKSVRIMKGAVIKVRKGAEIHIGNNVSIGPHTCISALNGGKISIGNCVGIGEYNRIICHKGITVKDNTIIAPHVYIYDHDHIFTVNGIERKKFNTEEVMIGQNSWIAINNVILKGTEIGDNCVVGAGCVVRGKIDSRCVLIQKRENIVNQIHEK